MLNKMRYKILLTVLFCLFTASSGAGDALKSWLVSKGLNLRQLSDRRNSDTNELNKLACASMSRTDIKKLQASATIATNDQSHPYCTPIQVATASTRKSQMMSFVKSVPHDRVAVRCHIGSRALVRESVATHRSGRSTRASRFRSPDQRGPRLPKAEPNEAARSSSIDRIRV